jgi:hypothetical protein
VDHREASLLGRCPGFVVKPAEQLQPVSVHIDHPAEMGPNIPVVVVILDARYTAEPVVSMAGINGSGVKEI